MDPAVIMMMQLMLGFILAGGWGEQLDSPVGKSNSTNHAHLFAHLEVVWSASSTGGNTQLTVIPGTPGSLSREFFRFSHQLEGVSRLGPDLLLKQEIVRSMNGKKSLKYLCIWDGERFIFANGGHDKAYDLVMLQTNHPFPDIFPLVLLAHHAALQGEIAADTSEPTPPKSKPTQSPGITRRTRIQDRVVELTSVIDPVTKHVSEIAIATDDSETPITCEFGDYRPFDNVDLPYRFSICGLRGQQGTKLQYSVSEYRRTKFEPSLTKFVPTTRTQVRDLIKGGRYYISPESVAHRNPKQPMKRADDSLQTIALFALFAIVILVLIQRRRQQSRHESLTIADPFQVE